VSHGQPDVTLDFHLTDPQSGVASVFYVASSPSGDQTLSGSIQTLFSGTPQDGHWDAVLTLGSHAEAGIWRLRSVQVTDAVNNAATLANADLPATNRFTVTGTAVTVPSAPAFVTATAGNHSATLSWGSRLITAARRSPATSSQRAPRSCRPFPPTPSPPPSPASPTAPR
jgi:hypothetical protein